MEQPEDAEPMLRAELLLGMGSRGSWLCGRRAIVLQATVVNLRYSSLPMRRFSLASEAWQADHAPVSFLALRTGVAGDLKEWGVG